MNGIRAGLLDLERRVLKAVIQPASREDRSIQEANLYCHLFYYGDIPRLTLKDRQTVDFSQTQRALWQHFVSADFAYHRFWLIDLATVAQLVSRYRGNESAMRVVAEMSEKVRFSISGDRAADSKALAQKVLQYADSIVA
jgi:hypothetical protein